MNRDAVVAARDVRLPDDDHVFEMTEYDRRVWVCAFEWYNKYMDLPRLSMDDGGAFSKVFLSLKKAKQYGSSW